MTRPPDSPAASGTSAGLLGRMLFLSGVAALLSITLASPGATRMYAWPWSLAYGLTSIIPVLMLLLRLSVRRQSFVLPSPAWAGLAMVFAGGVLLSALLSPFRGPALQGNVPLMCAVALFFVLVDWLHATPETTAAKQNQLLTGAGWFLAAVALTSMGLWAARLPEFSQVRSLFDARNPYPLGHSNYTAGLALLMLPCFGALIGRERGRRRLFWIGALVLALAMLATSGSRGGLIGLAVLAVVFAPHLARVLHLKLWHVAAIGVLLVAGLLVLHPRTRAILRPAPAGAEPNISNVQRSAMLTAGLRMGRDRPLTGWGAGSTPLVYPRYRAGLEGGAENVLQLHSTPVQLWAELGVIGLGSGLVLLLLGLGAAARDRPSGARVVFLGLGGYGVFSLTDWQGDVPVFALGAGLAAALLAPPQGSSRPAPRIAVGVMAFLATGLIVALGHRDPAPRLTVRALELADQPAHRDEAIALLQKSLALNPGQEIAHFNLGWLLVVRDPPAAERHFRAAAQLVPDKGGVYFGLGLARLNQNQPEAAARAFALECLNDPLFHTSPWWRTAPFDELRRTHAGEFIQLSQDTAARLAARGGWIAREAAYNAALTEWLSGRSSPGSMLAHSHTAARVNYFARRPAPPEFLTGPVRVYRHERTGYPVLMRDLDLPVPRDLYDVQETPLAADDLRFLFPRKGWLPSPLLLTLLEERIPPPIPVAP